ncbi:MAG: RNA degradosome polyphosphate kinase, partial [Phototrophicales bacterium]
MSEDVTELFNRLTGYAQKPDYHKLFVAPEHMRSNLERLIDAEIAHAQAGNTAYIIMKANSLTDARMIEKLYQASRAGVKIDLIIRGICCLRPAVPNISDNIHVRSIIG